MNHNILRYYLKNNKKTIGPNILIILSLYPPNVLLTCVWLC